jgi:hypothetical protein
MKELMFRNLTTVAIFLLVLACKNSVGTDNKNPNKPEVIDSSGKTVDFSKDQKPPPPTNEDLKKEKKTVKRREQ